MFQKVLQRVNGAISLSLSCWALPFCFTCNDFYITNIIGISHIGQWLVRKNTEKWPWEGNPRSDLVGFELQTHKQTTYNIASISSESVLIWHLLDSGLRELDQTPRHMFKPYQTKQGNRFFSFTAFHIPRLSSKAIHLFKSHNKTLAPAFALSPSFKKIHTHSHSLSHTPQAFTESADGWIVSGPCIAGSADVAD